MKKFFPLALIIFLIVSCEKNINKTGMQSAALCADTAFLQTDIREPLESVFFVNENNGFVAGSNGGIYKTSDAGKSWVSENSGVTLPVHGLYFLNEQTGFAVGGENFCGETGCIVPGGFILKTDDGGKTWKNVHTPTDRIEVRSVFFVSASTGFCVGVNVVFKTIDGGENWNEYHINGLNGNMMEVKFANEQDGYIACLFNNIAKTNDGGLTWQIVHPHQNGNNFGFYTLSITNNSIYLAGQTTILKSIDKGNTWTEFPHSPTDIFAIHFINDNQGFAFGRGNYSGGDFGYSYGSIFCSEDGGNNWNGTADIKETGLISDVSFPTNNVGYAISGFKIIKLVIK